MSLSGDKDVPTDIREVTDIHLGRIMRLHLFLFSPVYQNT